MNIQSVESGQREVRMVGLYREVFVSLLAEPSFPLLSHCASEDPSLPGQMVLNRVMDGNMQTPRGERDG